MMLTQKSYTLLILSFFISPIPIPITFSLPLELLSITSDVEWSVLYQRATGVEVTEKMHHHPPEGKYLKQKKKKISYSFLILQSLQSP